MKYTIEITKGQVPSGASVYMVVLSDEKGSDRIISWTSLPQDVAGIVSGMVQRRLSETAPTAHERLIVALMDEQGCTREAAEEMVQLLITVGLSKKRMDELRGVGSAAA